MPHALPNRRQFLLDAVAAGLSLPWVFPASRAGAQGRKLVVGFTIWDQTLPFFAAFVNSLKKAAGENNIELRLADPKMDVSVQVQQVLEFIVQKVDVIGIVPVDVRGILPAARAARKASIPIVGCNGIVEGYPYIGADHLDMGRQMGRLIVQALDASGAPGPYNVALLRGDAAGRVDRERNDGIREILAGRPDVTIAAEVVTDWIPDRGLSGVQDLLQKFPSGKLNLIHGFGGAIEVRGARYARVTAGRPEVIFTGCELTKQTAEAISEKWEYGVVIQDPAEFGRILMNAFPRMAPGFDKVPADVTVPRPICTRANLTSFTAF